MKRPVKLRRVVEYADCPDCRRMAIEKEEILSTLRTAEERNEVLCGVIRLSDGLSQDRKEAAKRRSLVVGNLCCFW